MRYGTDRNSQQEQGRQRRRLKTKPLLVLIAILAFTNILWFIGWLMPDKKPIADLEEVASVDGKPITREEWLDAMEKRVGRDVLLDLVNDRVMEAAAKKYGIEATDAEVDLELALLTSVDGTSHSGLDAESTRQKIRSTLFLEKVLTNDVVISDQAAEAYYEENAALFNVLTAYRTAAIYLPTKKEAEETVKELSKGSDFGALAKERSTDLSSASLGGDLGYLNEASETADRAIIEAIPGLKKGAGEKVVHLSDGTYAAIRVSEIIDGRSFSYEQVKDHIKREIALEQLSQSVTPEAFWKEFNAKWFYGE